MKTRLYSQVKLGEIITAQVIEQISQHEFIVSINGELIQIQNKSQEVFAVDSSVRLQVIGTHPLKLQMYSEKSRGAKRGGFGVSV